MNVDKSNGNDKMPISHRSNMYLLWMRSDVKKNKHIDVVKSLVGYGIKQTFADQFKCEASED